MSRAMALLLAMLLSVAAPVMAEQGVIEQLRLAVPEVLRSGNHAAI